MLLASGEKIKPIKFQLSNNSFTNKMTTSSTQVLFNVCKTRCQSVNVAEGPAEKAG